jgi:integrase
LGFQLRVEGEQLKQFGAFVDDCSYRGPLTTELALRWARLPANGDSLYWARRLEVVRCFAKHLAISEPRTEVPPRGLLGRAHRRKTPYIFSDADLAALLAAARRLAPSNGLRPKTYVALIGTLASTGLRISEALRLTRADADLHGGVLKIRETKFRKTRWVPIHSTTVAALQSYSRARDRLAGRQSDAFFVSSEGRALPYSTARGVFRKLCDSVKLTARGGVRRPRLHDLRHSFACRRVARWYDAGINLDHAVSALSVYLGHVKVSDTYWYLTATPDLLARAASRFEAFAPAAPGEVNR